MQSIPVEVLDIILQYSIGSGAFRLSNLLLVNKQWKEAVEYSDQLPTVIARTCFSHLSRCGLKRERKFTWRALKNGVLQAVALAPVPPSTLAPIEDCDQCETCPFFAENLADIVSDTKAPATLHCSQCSKTVPVFNPESKTFAKRTCEEGKPWVPVFKKTVKRDPSDPFAGMMLEGIGVRPKSPGHVAKEWKLSHTLRPPADTFTYVSVLVDADGRWGHKVLRSLRAVKSVTLDIEELDKKSKKLEAVTGYTPYYRYMAPSLTGLTFAPFRYVGGSCAHQYELYAITARSKAEVEAAIKRLDLEGTRFTFVFYQSEDVKANANLEGQYEGKTVVYSGPFSSSDEDLLAVGREICTRLEGCCGSETISPTSPATPDEVPEEPVSDVDACTAKVRFY